MNRAVAAARMQTVHPLVSLGLPWAIVGLSFAINLVVWRVGDVAAQSPGDGSTGGLGSLYATVLVIFIQAVTHMFPLAMGLSLSRRDFFAGTALAAVVQSAWYGLALVVLTVIEDATNGWGIRLHFWAPSFLHVDNIALQFLVFAVPMLACAFLGIALGVVWKRWGTPGIYALLLISLLLAGVAAIWITWLKAWTEIGGWFADQSVSVLTIALPAALIVVLAGLAFQGLRRTVP